MSFVEEAKKAEKRRKDKAENNRGIKRDHFFMIDNDYVTLYAKHLGVMATAVYTSLRKHADIETNRCWPSMELMAEQHGIDRHTVSRALKRLEEWNIISTKRAIDRKNKKRKNNVYELLPKELWKKPPVEDEYPIHTVSIPDHHGTEDTTQMASRMPYDGTEDTSNKTHIIKTIKENLICRQESADTSLKMPAQSTAWDSNKAILGLVKSDYKDYRIIGQYFYSQKRHFQEKQFFDAEFKRALRAANLLKEYPIEGIKKMMKMLNNSEYEMGWKLETVYKYIEDTLSPECDVNQIILEEDDDGKSLERE